MATKYIYNEKYGLTLRSSDNANVHEVPQDDPLYLDYIDWISQPNQQMDVVDRIVPEWVTPVQMRKALNGAGLRTQVEAAVKAMGQDAQDTWEYSEQIQRNHPLVVAMGQQFGVDLDSLFITAATL
jgi:hypothetical protein